MVDDAPSPHGSHRFPTTAWTALQEIRQAPAAERTAQKNSFIVRYWKPVFGFLRAGSYTLEQAEELTQAFFVDLLEGEDILGADPERGRFRTFLLTLLKRFLSDRFNPKRLPRQAVFESHFVPIASLISDEDRSYEPPTDETPDNVFMRKWARDLIEEVCQGVKDLFEKRGQPEYYELFTAAQEVIPGEEGTTQDELGARFGLTRDGVKYRLKIVKQAFLLRLRTEVRDQVGSDAEIDVEIGELLALLSR
jgi:RNA polymerase sigma-70 factor (ECF subfamily)